MYNYERIFLNGHVERAKSMAHKWNESCIMHKLVSTIKSESLSIGSNVI